MTSGPNFLVPGEILLAARSHQARFADLGAAVFPGSSSDFAKFIATETSQGDQVLRG